jgi:hypothetical protein
MPKNRLFVAALVLESKADGGDANTLVDHQVRVIRAPNAKAAYDRALRLGEAENAAYKDSEGETLTWQFLGLSELDQLDERQLQDGGEVFSWRTRGSGRVFVRQKDQLSAFAPKH